MLEFGLRRVGKWLMRKGIAAFYPSTITSEGLLEDRIGTGTRAVQPARFGNFLLTETLDSAHLTGSETIVSSEGTAVFSVGVGALTCTTAGTAWRIVLSDGTIWIFPQKIGTDGIWFSTTGENYATAGVADVDAHCGSGTTTGEDWLNQQGYTVSDGSTYYYDTAHTTLIPSGALIPALADGSGCAAFLVDGSVAPLQYSGRVKYNCTPTNTPAPVFDGTSSHILTGVNATGYFKGKIRFFIDSPLSATTSRLFGGDGSGDIRTYGYTNWGLTGTTPVVNLNISEITTEEIHELIIELIDGGFGVGTTCNLWFDGVKKVDGEVTTGVYDWSFSDIYIGRYTTTYFPGKVVDFTFYEQSGESIYFPLEESSGTTVYGYKSDGTVVAGTISTADINAFWAGVVDGVLSHGCEFGYSERENFAKYNRDFTNAVWVKQANASFSGATGNQIYTLAGSTLRAVYQTVIAAGTDYNGTLYVNYDITPIQSGQISIFAASATGTSYAIERIVTLTSGVRASGSVEIDCSGFTTDGLSVKFYESSGNTGDRFYLHSLDVSLNGKETTDTDDSIIVGRQPCNPNTGLDCLGNSLTVQPGGWNGGNKWAAPICLELRAADFSNTLYTAGVPNDLDYATLQAASPIDNNILAGRRGAGVYSAALTGTNKTRADKFFEA